MRLIDADKFLSQIEDQYMEHDITREKYVDLSDRIMQQPIIEERKKGRWIFYESENDRYEDIKCPFCKKSYTVDVYRIDNIGFTAEDFNYCPNCGADMRTAAQIVHDAIDNTPMAEDAYPGIKERLHKAVDDMREGTT